MGIWYTTREAVKAAPDIAETARNDAQVDRAIEAASRSVEGLLHRRFYPVVDARSFDWPDGSYSRPWRLWLGGEDGLISVTSLTSGGTLLSPSDYLLEPVNSGPPYDRVEINLGGSGSFASGSTAQQSLVIAGVWGYDLDEVVAGFGEKIANRRAAVPGAREQRDDACQPDGNSVAESDTEAHRMLMGLQ